MSRPSIIAAHPAAVLIGHVPDSLVASIIGVTRAAVYNHRTARGIRAVDPRVFVEDEAAQAALRTEAAGEVADRPDRAHKVNAACAAWVPGWVPMWPEGVQP